MGDNIEYGTFRWDAEAQRLTAIALPGMPAVNNRTFSGAGGQTPVINNQNEIAFVGEIQNAAGTSQPGVFLLGRDGKLRPVALPDQELPGGGPISGAFVPSLNDAGVVAYFARRPANLVCDHLVFGWGLMARRLYYPAPRHLREPDLQLPNGGTAPEGLINAAFLDGHVKALKHEQFWEILPAYTHRGTPTSDVFRYFWPYE